MTAEIDHELGEGELASVNGDNLPGKLILTPKDEEEEAWRIHEGVGYEPLAEEIQVKSEGPTS